MFKHSVPDDSSRTIYYRGSPRSKGFHKFHRVFTEALIPQATLYRAKQPIQGSVNLTSIIVARLRRLKIASRHDQIGETFLTVAIWRHGFEGGGDGRGEGGALFIVNRRLRKSTRALSTLFNVRESHAHGTQRRRAPTRRRDARPRGKLAARGEYIHLKAFSLVPSHAMCASCSPCGSYPFVNGASLRES